jgi:2-iminobutanoate/2-iminopropanoate deaminase
VVPRVERPEKGDNMAIKREKIQPAGIHVRMMAGQPAYTQVVTVSGTGKMIFVAGQLARDPDGNCVGKGDMRAQIQQVGENIKACLEAAGASLADMVKTNTFVTNYEEFAKHGDMRLRYFGPATPTSTTVQISRLADPDAMIEIEAIAVVDG